MEIIKNIAALSNVLPHFTFLAVLVIFISAIITAVRYRVIINKVFFGKLSLFDSFFITCNSNLVNYIMPLKVGVIVTKPYLTKKLSDISFKKSLASVGFEQFFEIAFQMIMLPFLLLFLGKSIFLEKTVIFLFITLLLIIFLCIIRRDYLIKILFKLIMFAPSSIRKILKKRMITENSLKNFLEKAIYSMSNLRFFLSLTLWTVLITLSSPLIITFVTYSLGLYISYVQSFLAYWISIILGRLSGLPGGIGVRDVTITSILTYFGFGLQQSILITILYRVLTTLFYIITGTLLVFLVSKFRALKNKRLLSIIRMLIS
jgi:uncharacterized protein (TIRG00374 family)